MMFQCYMYCNVWGDSNQAAITPCIAAIVSAMSSSDMFAKKVRNTSGRGSFERKGRISHVRDSAFFVLR